MRLAAVFTLSSALLAGADNIRSIPDVEVKTPAGNIRAVNLSVKKGGRTRLTGTLINDSGKNWDFLTIQILPADGRGTRFNAASLNLFGVTPGASKPFYLDTSGKFDFPTLTYSMTYQSGSYAAKYAFEMIAPTPTGQLQFADEVTTWRFLPTETALAFELINKSDKVARLDWNQAAYVDASGKAHKVAATGTRYIEVNSTKPPTVIPPGANIREAVVPTDHVSYSGRWRVEPIFPKCPECRTLAGSEFRIFMPLDIGGTQKEYTFRIRVISVE